MVRFHYHPPIMEYYCSHQGRKSELSNPICLAIKAGKIKIKGHIACDFNIPADINELEKLETNSIDITCVGPESSACPDPTQVNFKSNT